MVVAYFTKKGAACDSIGNSGGGGERPAGMVMIMHKGAVIGTKVLAAVMLIVCGAFPAHAAEAQDKCSAAAADLKVLSAELSVVAASAAKTRGEVVDLNAGVSRRMMEAMLAESESKRLKAVVAEQDTLIKSSAKKIADLEAEVQRMAGVLRKKDSEIDRAIASVKAAMSAAVGTAAAETVGGTVVRSDKVGKAFFLPGVGTVTVKDAGGEEYHVSVPAAAAKEAEKLFGNAVRGRVSMGESIQYSINRSAMSYSASGGQP